MRHQPSRRTRTTTSPLSARVDPHKLAVMRVSVDDACNFLKRVVTRAIRLARCSIGWSNGAKSVTRGRWRDGRRDAMHEIVTISRADDRSDGSSSRAASVEYVTSKEEEGEM